MSWLQEVASFAKRLILLEQRVEDNAQTIKELREELKALTEFSRRVAAIVERNQAAADDRHKLLVTQLQNELLRLENRVLVNNQKHQQVKGELSPSDKD